MIVTILPLMSDGVIGALIGACATIAALALNWLFKWIWVKYWKKHNRRCEFKDNIAVASELKRAASKIVDDYGVDRVSMYLFHNGETFYRSDMKMKKMTMAIEEVSEGISKIQDQMKGLLTSFFAEILRAVYNDNQYLQPEIADIKDRGFRTFISGLGTKSIYAFGMRDLDGELIGMMVLESIKHQYHMSDADIDKIAHCATLLSGHIRTKALP